MYSFADYKDVDAAYWGVGSTPGGPRATVPATELPGAAPRKDGLEDGEWLPPEDYDDDKVEFQARWSEKLQDMQRAPEENASLFSKYFFTWLNPCIALAHSEALEEQMFPIPRRDHRVQMSGSRLSEDFRQIEMLDGRLLWSQYVEAVLPPSDSAASSSAGGTPPQEFRVQANNMSEVMFKGEPCVRGRLRWIGSVRCCDAPQKLYAGVEWNNEIPNYRTALIQEHREGMEGLVHRGEVHGEQLFHQAAVDAPPRCTLEPVENLVLLHTPCRYRSRYPSGKEPLYPRQANLMWSLLRTFRKDLWGIVPGAVGQFLCFNVATPILIRWYVEYLQDDGASIPLGIALALVFLVVKGVEPLASNKFEQRTERVASLFRTATLAVLFEKCLTISSDSFAHPEVSAGRVLTMASGDVENIKEFPIDVVYLVMAPAILLFVLGNMLFLVGWSALGGVLAISLVLPIQGMLVRWQEKLQKRGSEETDRRLRLTNELLSGIRVVKMMGWEKNFLDAIHKAREQELAYRKKMQLAEVFVSLANDGTSISVLMIVITIYVATGHDLAPEVALPIIAMLGSLMYGLMMFPVAVNTVVKFIVSCRRLSRFLECEDATPSVEDITALFSKSRNDDHHSARESSSGDQTATEDSDIVARFEKATVKALITTLVVPLLPQPKRLPKFLRKWFSFAFSPTLPVEVQWRRAGEGRAPSPAPTSSEGLQKNSSNEEDAEEDGEERVASHAVLSSKVLLRSLCLDVHRQGLTMVIGPTGSGKSVLLQSLLDAFILVKDGGRIWATKSIAFVPQQPWIMQDSIRFNITFFDGMDKGRPIERSGGNNGEDSARLEAAVAACQLAEDLKDMPNGLDSEIGERGVNLSGGQKARISLARAVYANKELYLLDDPLSALDAHVGDRVLHEVILGQLKEKAVVLVTHQLHYLPYAQRIIVMKDGEVQFNGGYDAYTRSKFRAEMEAMATTEAEEKQVPVEGVVIDDVVSSPVGLDAPAQIPSAQTAPSASASDPGVSRETTDVMADNPDAVDGSSTVVATGAWMTEEEKAHGSVPYQIYKAYFKSGGGVMPLCTAVLLFVLFNATYMIASAWLSLWSARAFTSISDTAALWIYLLTQGSALIFAPLSKYCVFRINLQASKKMHRSVLRSVSTGTLGFFDSVPLGRILNRFSKDMYVLDDEIPQHMLLLLDIGCYVISTLVLAIIAMPSVTLVVLIAAVGFYFLLRYYTTIIREVRRRGSIAESPMFSMLESILNNGRDTLVAYGKSHFFFQEALSRLDRLYSCMYIERVMDQWLNIRIEYLGGFIMFSVTCIGLVQKLLSPGRKMPSETLALISLSLTMCVDLFWSLPLIVKVAAWTEASMNSAQRIQHYVDGIPTEDLLLDTEEQDGGVQEVTLVDVHREDNAARQDGSTPYMAFEHVYMRYRDGLPCVLRDVSFALYPKEKVGVVGRTGSGKSTLLLTFMRLAEISQGQIKVHGRPITQYTLPDLRRQFALIPQDPVLFEGTIRSNLDPFGERTEAEVERVLGLIGLQGVTASTAAGDEPRAITPDTTVSEGGKNFSVGQRQLLCMGRALLKKGNSFVLMDEATANVDPQLDRRLQDVIHTCFAPYVVVTIAHRLYTVASYDKIIVMHKGQVVEQGSPRQLIQTSSSQLYKMVVRSAVGPSTPAAERDAMIQAAVGKFLDRCQR